LLRDVASEYAENWSKSYRYREEKTMKRKFSMLCVLCLVLTLVLVACQTNEQKPEGASVTTSQERITVSIQDTTYDTEDGFVPIVEKLTDFEDDLDAWLGKYEYWEDVLGSHFVIDITKENDKYFAEIIANGYQQGGHYKAMVQGNRSKIDFLFEEYFEDNMFELPALYKGTLLLRLERKSQKLLTWWGWHVRPGTPKNYAQGKEDIIKIE
jgi:hypothetical protein